MTAFLSPGVFTREIDLSLYVPNLSTTALGIVGLAQKGPINVPTYVTDPVQFATIFGDTVADFKGPYAALQYLHTGRQCFYVRVSELDPNQEAPEPYLAKTAAADLLENATQATVTGDINTLIALTGSNNTLHFIVDGSEPGFDVALPSSVTLSISQIIALLNADTTFNQYMTASSSLSGTLKITSNIAGANHSIQVGGNAVTNNNIFGFDPLASTENVTPTTFGTGGTTETAYIIGSNASSTFTVGSGTNTLYVLMGTTKFTAAAPAGSPAGVTSFTIPQNTYTLAQLVTAINAVSGFSTHLIASSFVAKSGIGQLKIQLKSSSANKHLSLYTGSNDAGPVLFGFVSGETTTLGNPVTFPITIDHTNDQLVFTLGEAAPGDGNDAAVTTVAHATYANVGDLIAGIEGSTTYFTLNSVTTSGILSDELTLTNSGDSIVATLKNGSTYISLAFDQTASGFLPLFGVLPTEKEDTTASDTTLSVLAASAGTWGNNLALEILNVDPVAKSFTLSVYEKNFLVESYRNLVKTPLTIPDPANPAATIDNPNYVENAINGVSSRIVVTNPVDDTTSSGFNETLPLATGLNFKTVFTGGTNGNPPANVHNPALYIGISDGTVKSGLQFFRNPEEIDLNLIAVPGISDAAVINEMIDICTTRGDAMCIVDPPQFSTTGATLTPQNMVDWVNGAGVYASDHQAFNSSYAATYWPWLQIYDPVLQNTVWTPPSGHVAQVYAYTDLVSDTWIAPAGLTRGRITTPLAAAYTPTKGEMDLLYLSNVNPLATFIRDGITVWGQKTLWRSPTALDRVNVRRLMLYLEKVVATAARQLLFEPDDATTWIQFVNLVTPFMQSVKDRRGLVDFQVRCDATTNPPDAVDRNEMHAIIFLKPTKAAEFIQIDFVLTAQGANFNELVY